MLKQALDEGGPPLRNLEAMDHIHERMRNRANEGLVKLEPIIRKQLHSLYYERKVNLYTLTQEKKRIDDMNVEKLMKKTQVPINLMTQQEEEIRSLVKQYNINIKGMKLPYSMKIKQICAHLAAFYRYKKDQREILDFSLLKSKEFQEMQNNYFMDLKVLTKAECFGEKSLTPEEYQVYDKLMYKEIDDKNPALS